MNKIKELGLKNKIIIHNFLFLIVLAGVVFFVILPSLADIKEIRSEVEDQKLDLEKKYLQGQNLKSIKRKVEQVEPQLEKLDKIFIDLSRNLEFITSLEEVASKNSVDQKIDLRNPENFDFKKNYASAPINLSVSGSPENIFSYLVDLENLFYYLNFDFLKISRISSIENSSRISLILRGETFWKK